MEIHAVVLGTRLVLHEVWAVLGGAQGGLQRPPVDEDVVDRLDGPQRVLRFVVCNIGARARTLQRQNDWFLIIFQLTTACGTRGTRVTIPDLFCQICPVGTGTVHYKKKCQNKILTRKGDPIKTDPQHSTGRYGTGRADFSSPTFS